MVAVCRRSGLYPVERGHGHGPSGHSARLAGAAAGNSARCFLDTLSCQCVARPVGRAESGPAPYSSDRPRGSDRSRPCHRAAAGRGRGGDLCRQAAFSHGAGQSVPGHRLPAAAGEYFPQCRRGCPLGDQVPLFRPRGGLCLRYFPICRCPAAAACRRRTVCRPRFRQCPDGTADRRFGRAGQILDDRHSCFTTGGVSFGDIHRQRPLPAADRRYRLLPASGGGELGADLSDHRSFWGAADVAGGLFLRLRTGQSAPFHYRQFFPV